MRQLWLSAALLVLHTAGASAVPVIGDAREPKSGCLSYDDSSVTPSGTAFSRIYFGPPNYGETPAQDVRERALLLLLDAPVCVNASPHPERSNDTYEGDVIVVQLAAVHVSSALLWKSDGQRITVKGRLFHAITGHHRTAVVMDVYSVKDAVP